MFVFAFVFAGNAVYGSLAITKDKFNTFADRRKSCHLKTIFFEIETQKSPIVRDNPIVWNFLFCVRLKLTMLIVIVYDLKTYRLHSILYMVSSGVVYYICVCVCVKCNTMFD